MDGLFTLHWTWRCLRSLAQFLLPSIKKTKLCGWKWLAPDMKKDERCQRRFTVMMKTKKTLDCWPEI